jgi:hypothetical protein
MVSLIKSTILGVGLLTGIAAAAHAQSISALPPDGGMPGQTARSPVTGSTQSFFPKPGGAEVLKEEHYQPPADWDANKAAHPYSTSIGPSPGSHSSGRDTHYATPPGWESATGMHPYSSGAGPKPN